MKQGHKVMESNGEELKFEYLEHVYLDYMRVGIGLEPEVIDHA